jgi:hypothetical protein
MRLDDSKHKVYIYNIDDELSSDSDADDNGKLVFLPDIEKHLKKHSRIPRHILANDDGELAGMQMVLYSDPKSLSVPEEKDGVRKAIIDARRRHRDRQHLERSAGQPLSSAGAAPVTGASPAAPITSLNSDNNDTSGSADVMDMDLD